MSNETDILNTNNGHEVTTELKQLLVDHIISHVGFEPTTTSEHNYMLL